MLISLIVSLLPDTARLDHEPAVFLVLAALFLAVAGAVRTHASRP